MCISWVFFINTLIFFSMYFAAISVAYFMIYTEDSLCIYIYIYIPLHSCDYLKKVSIRISVATEEGGSRNET